MGSDHLGVSVPEEQIRADPSGGAGNCRWIYIHFLSSETASIFDLLLNISKTSSFDICLKP